MDIDIREVLDYCFCPMMYKHKYLNKSKKKKKISIIEKYEYDIHRAIYSFFNALQNNESVTLREVTRIWGSLWLGNKTKYDIVYSKSLSWGVIENERRKRGVDTLVYVFNYYRKDPGILLAINHPYKVDLGDNIFLTGSWELIREIKDKDIQIIEIIDFKNNDKVHNKVAVGNDLEITAASYAFRKTFNTKEDVIVYFGLDKKKVHKTTRSERDFKVLEHTVKCVAYAINHNLFYANPDSKCYTCPYRLVCDTNMDYGIIKPGSDFNAINATKK